MKGILEILIGKRLRSSEESAERLSNTTALAILSSDALSSVAYATEEILFVLVVGALSLTWAFPVALSIIILLAILTFSYRQIILAYPQGAGAYIVAGENLSTLAGLVAGAALLLDYILTVSVSISAGTAALTSAIPQLHNWKLIVAFILCIGLTIGNLRGVRESGKIFRLPTLFFIGIMATLIIIGAFRFLIGDVPPVTLVAAPVVSLGGIVWYVFIFRLLHTFASGSTALTGIEAISNGTKIFREPAGLNARKTLTWMAAILAFLFLGVTFLAVQFGVVPREGETVLSQLARVVFANKWIAWLYYLTQIATMFVLVLAANTAFAGFPRLSQFIAKDHFLPRYFTTRGGRLVFSNGIIILMIAASAILILFRADTHKIIPLYMVGVFVSFTLSQAGMARRYFKSKEKKDYHRALINSVGAIVTSIVLFVVLTTKFLDGAWIVFVAIPTLVLFFLVIHRHYAKRASSIRAFLGSEQIQAWKKAIQKANITHERIKNFVQESAKRGDEKFALVQRSYIILLSSINEAVIMALYGVINEFSRHHVEVFHVALDDDEAQRTKAEWEKIIIEEMGFPSEIELRVVIDEYRDVIGALEKEIWEKKKHWTKDKLAVKIPHLDYPSIFDYFLTANYSVRIALALRRLIERKEKEELQKTSIAGEEIYKHEVEIDLVSYLVHSPNSFMPVFFEEVREIIRGIKNFLDSRFGKKSLPNQGR